MKAARWPYYKVESKPYREMPSSIVSTIAPLAAEEEMSDIPPIEEASPEPKAEKPRQQGPRQPNSGATRGGRVGEGGAPRARNPQGPGADASRPRQQYANRAPGLIPGQIEEPTRTNVFVPPSCIFFTQRSIPSHFADGKSLQETFDAIAKREMRKRDLPMIDVVWKEGAYWTLSNRRLAVFSELERRNLAKQVKIKIVPLEDAAHGHLEPFIAFWRKNPPRQNASVGEPGFLPPVPGGMPEGWGGEAPVFSSDLTGEITVIGRATPMETEEKPIAEAKALPPLVKMSSSEDEQSGAGAVGPDVRHVVAGHAAAATPSSDLKRPRNNPGAKFDGVENKGIKRPADGKSAGVVSAVNGHSCMCNDVVNVFNKARKGASKPLAAFFLKNSRPNKYQAELKKPAEVSAFVCGCGHEEKTLVALGKHKDRTGHACWNNNTYDSLRDLILNEDLRISCGGAVA